MSDEAEVIDIIQAQEQWANDTVNFLIDMNDVLSGQGHKPSTRANNLLDRYFALQDRKQAAKNG